MNNDPKGPVDYDAMHNALAVVLLVGMGVILLVLVYASGCDVNGQTITPILVPMPMPPDLLNAKPECTLREYESNEVINAKTGEVEQRTRWLVEPYATYPDHRPKWELPPEPLPTNHAVMHPGSIADVSSGHEAIDVCEAWRREVKKRAAALREQAKKGAPR